MGHCYAMLQDKFNALACYQRALDMTEESQVIVLISFLKRKKRDDQLWCGIGLLYQKVEDWKNAETAFKNALRLNPKGNLRAEVLYNLGMIMRRKGAHRDAAKVINNSMSINLFRC